MTKTVELTDLVIKSIHLNYEMQYVRVLFSMVDSAGVEWQSGDAYFWVTIPIADPIPDNWFQLPESYFPTLLALQSDADTALTAKFLV